MCLYLYLTICCHVPFWACLSLNRINSIQQLWEISDCVDISWCMLWEILIRVNPLIYSRLRFQSLYESFEGGRALNFQSEFKTCLLAPLLELGIYTTAFIKSGDRPWIQSIPNYSLWYNGAYAATISSCLANNSKLNVTCLSSSRYYLSYFLWRSKKDRGEVLIPCVKNSARTSRATRL